MLHYRDGLEREDNRVSDWRGEGMAKNAIHRSTQGACFRKSVKSMDSCLGLRNRCYGRKRHEMQQARSRITST